MKRLIIRPCRMAMVMVLAASGTLTASADVLIDEENFPDANFRAYVKTLAGGSDGVFTLEELAAIKTIQIGRKAISNLKGIEYFEALEELYATRIGVTSVDLSALTNLKVIHLGENKLDSLDLSKNTKLETLYCNDNASLTSLDMSGHASLTTLGCYNCGNLVSLNVSGCAALQTLDCHKSKLTSLDVSGCNELTYYDCSYNELTGEVDVNGKTKLQKLFANNNKLTSLNVSGCTALTFVNCYENALASLNVSGCAALQTLDCHKNQLTSLDLSGCAALTTLNCSGNARTVEAPNEWVETLKFYLPIDNDESNPLYVDGFRIENASDWSNATVIEEDGKKMLAIKDAAKAVTYKYNTGIEGKSVTFTLNIDATKVGLLIDEENFPDAKFRAYVKTLAGGSDGVFTAAELAAIKAINVYGKAISNLKGIEYFEALEELYATGIGVTSVDLSALTNLKVIHLGENKLNSLDLSKNTKLETLYCNDNASLTSLDMSGHASLTTLGCYNCGNLASLNVSGCTALQTLKCQNSALTCLDLSENTALTTLDCTGNKHEVDVNFKYEKDGKTYYYIDMAADEREGMSGDELHNKLGEGFCVENVTSWTGATVGKTPAGANALIFEGQPTSITYVYNTKAPQSGAVDSNMTVTLNLNYDKMPTSVGDIDADEAVRIYSAAGMIRIVGSEAEARVYDMTGHCIYAGLDREVAVSAGLYIVKVGATAKKIAVR